MMFNLDKRLLKDTFFVADLDLCQILLMNNAHFPWSILVPRVANISEIYELSKSHCEQIHQETMLFSKAMAKEFRADKINIASLGNVVPQLHIHVIVRYQNDPAWPRPVWGVKLPKAYTEIQSKEMINRLKIAMQTVF